MGSHDWQADNNWDLELLFEDHAKQMASDEDLLVGRAISVLRDHLTIGKIVQLTDPEPSHVMKTSNSQNPN